MEGFKWKWKGQLKWRKTGTCPSLCGDFVTSSSLSWQIHMNKKNSNFQAFLPSSHRFWNIPSFHFGYCPLLYIYFLIFVQTHRRGSSSSFFFFSLLMKCNNWHTRCRTEPNRTDLLVQIKPNQTIYAVPFDFKFFFVIYKHFKSNSIWFYFKFYFL